MTELHRVDQSAQIDSLGAADFRAQYGAKLRQYNKSSNTRRSYQSDWNHFQKWCESRDLDSSVLDERSIIGYLLYWGDETVDRLDGDRLLSPSTLERRLFGIKFRYRSEGHRWPDHRGDEDLIGGTIRYLYVTRGKDPQGKKALSLKQLEAITDMFSDSPIEIRNRAILMVGFYGAMRRSEIVALDLKDVDFLDDDHPGVAIKIRRSKSDQMGRGRTIYISEQESRSYCPVQSLRSWMSLRGRAPGPLFTNLHNPGKSINGRLSPDLVNRVVKRGIVQLGMDSTRYGGHSLRSGFATEATKRGVEPRLIREQTGHSSYEMLDGYIQAGSSSINNATSVFRRH